jgi:uncharacterized spore protein YtfJ
MTDLDKLVKNTVGELDRLLNAKNVLGEPIDRDGATVIPLVSFGFGFGVGGGGGDLGGAGAGAGVRPVGAIILDKGGARIEAVQGVTTSLAHVIADTATRILDQRASRRAGRSGDEPGDASES